MLCKFKFSPVNVLSIHVTVSCGIHIMLTFDLSTVVSRCTRVLGVQGFLTVLLESEHLSMSIVLDKVHKPVKSP